MSASKLLSSSSLQEFITKQQYLYESWSLFFFFFFVEVTIACAKEFLNEVMIPKHTSYFDAPAETFVRVDGAFIPFADGFDISNVMTAVKGVGEIGDVKSIELKSPINSLIGKHVVKVGRSSGLTTGTIMAYALEYKDEKGICFFTDFLIVGENQKTFDLEGDNGSLIILMGEDGKKPRPVGFIWDGTANHGRLKLKSGHGLENWTSGVDLGRLLDLLELDLITTSAGLQGLCFSCLWK